MYDGNECKTDQSNQLNTNPKKESQFIEGMEQELNQLSKQKGNQ